MNDSFLWYAARGAGVVSLILLSAVFVLGIVTSVRWSNVALPRFVTAQLHRNLALLSLVFLGVHIVTAVVDPYTSLGWLTVIVPFSSDYRQLWLGLGVVSVDLALAVIVTSLLRDRVGHRVWRTVHWLAYGAWPLAVLHGLGTGTDAFAPWLLVVQGLCVAAVLAAVWWRMSVGRAGQRLGATGTLAAQRQGADAR
jgi:methionine sulfoxide reductase heme-binding subunit